MKKIMVEEIEDGMVLAKDVTGTSGNALLSKGTKLLASMGRRFKNWGIPYVVVEGESEDGDESNEHESSPEELKKKMTEQFRDVIDNPLMKDLMDAVFDFKCEKSTLS